MGASLVWRKGVKEMIGLRISINKQSEVPLSWSATGSGTAGTREGKTWNQPQGGSGRTGT